MCTPFASGGGHTPSYAKEMGITSTSYSTVRAVIIVCVFLGSVLKPPLVFSETRYQKSHPWILFFPSWRTKIMAQIFSNYYISRVEEVLSFAKFYGALWRLAQRGQNAKKCQNFQKNPLFSINLNRIWQDLAIISLQFVVILGDSKMANSPVLSGYGDTHCRQHPIFTLLT